MPLYKPFFRLVGSLILFSVFIVQGLAQVGRVGINTLSPAATLHVADSSVVFTGQATLPANPGPAPLSGTAGHRLVWYADKAAFLVGGAGANDWLRDSIGLRSAIVGGENNRTKGAGSFIGGGKNNRATQSYAFVGGGNDNRADNPNAAVIGGSFNRATSTGSVVGGGNYNRALGYVSFIGGGEYDSATAQRTFIGGGAYNKASNSCAFVGGGYGNRASGIESFVGGGLFGMATGTHSFVGGGEKDTASADRAFVAGGQRNKASDWNAFVGGGEDNKALEQCSFVGGGRKNNANGLNTAILGGFLNTAASINTFVGGGQLNAATGLLSFVGGGENNAASGDNAFIGGGRALLAKSYGETVFGIYSSDYTPSSTATFNANDRLFVVGNGESLSARRNALTILKDGRTGIGTDAPSVLLEVRGPDSSPSGATLGFGGKVADQAEAGRIRFFDGAAANNWRGIYLHHDGVANKFHIGVHTTSNNDPADDVPILTMERGDNQVGIGTTTPGFLLEVNGTAGKPGGGSWSASSDARLKTDIKTYTDGLESVLAIHPVTYRYNSLSGYDTAESHVGVIAQEVQAVAPYMVKVSDRKATDGSTGYLAVDNSAMTYILINAVKEQQAIILAQQANLKDQQASIDELRKFLESLSAELADVRARLKSSR